MANLPSGLEDESCSLPLIFATIPAALAENISSICVSGAIFAMMSSFTSSTGENGENGKLGNCG
jgi:hypothetical protein